MAQPRSFFKNLAATVLRVFFQRIEVVGEEQIPSGVPLLIVANHHNSLIDPTLLLGVLPVRPRFVAKSTLWDLPLMGRLLDAAGSIPVYRRQDEGADARRNLETFAACHDELAAGGTIALFPEGISHDAPHLAELRTGAARIVLEAEEKHPGLGVRIVPVGLTFDDKSRFRSRVLVRVGAPIDPTEALRLHATDPRAGARALTETIRTALQEVTLNYAGPQEATLVERAAEVYAVEGRELPGRVALAEAFALRQALLRTATRLREEHPERLARLAEHITSYEERLRRFGVRDDQLAASYPREELSLVVVGTLSLLLFWLPLATIGTLLNALPYRLVGLLPRFSSRNEDLPATLKLFGGFLLFPITWIVEVAAAGWLAGPVAALITAILAPSGGYFAMLFHERYTRFWEEAGAYLRLRWQDRRAGNLRAEREALRREVSQLVEEPRTGADPSVEAPAAEPPP